MVKLLLVEDDGALNKSLSRYLVSAGYDVHSASNADEAYAFMDKHKFDVVVTDLMLPETDGFELTEALKAADETTPVIFITARDDLHSKTRGFEIGIDDYLVKPFDPAELVMRVSAVVRRAGIKTAKRIEIGDFLMNEEEHCAYIDGEEIPLTVREFDLLFKLLSFPKKTFSRSRLMEEFWGYDSSSTSRAVDVCIVEIRKKTAKTTAFEIVTVHGLGYKAVIK